MFHRYFLAFGNYSENLHKLICLYTFLWIIYFETKFICIQGVYICLTKYSYFKKPHHSQELLESLYETLFLLHDCI